MNRLQRLIEKRDKWELKIRKLETQIERENQNMTRKKSISLGNVIVTEKEPERIYEKL